MHVHKYNFFKRARSIFLHEAYTRIISIVSHRRTVTIFHMRINSYTSKFYISHKKNYTRSWYLFTQGIILFHKDLFIFTWGFIYFYTRIHFFTQGFIFLHENLFFCPWEFLFFPQGFIFLRKNNLFTREELQKNILSRGLIFIFHTVMILHTRINHIMLLCIDIMTIKFF